MIHKQRKSTSSQCLKIEFQRTRTLLLAAVSSLQGISTQNNRITALEWTFQLIALCLVCSSFIFFLRQLPHLIAANCLNCLCLVTCLFWGKIYPCWRWLIPRLIDSPRHVDVSLRVGSPFTPDHYLRTPAPRFFFLPILLHYNKQYRNA